MRTRGCAALLSLVGCGRQEQPRDGDSTCNDGLGQERTAGRQAVCVCEGLPRALVLEGAVGEEGDEYLCPRQKGTWTFATFRDPPRYHTARHGCEMVVTRRGRHFHGRRLSEADGSKEGRRALRRVFILLSCICSVHCWLVLGVGRPPYVVASSRASYPALALVHARACAIVELCASRLQACGVLPAECRQCPGPVSRAACGMWDVGCGSRQ